MQKNAKPARLTIVSPVADYRDVDRAISAHAPRHGIGSKRVLLLPAEKSSSPPFIEALVARMTAETTATRVFTRNPEWAFFHPQRAAGIAPEIDALARECDLMISGVAY